MKLSSFSLIFAITGVIFGAAFGKTAAGAPELTVPRHVVAGGGGTSAGGQFTVSGTIGQPDADPLQPSTGGSYAITGGFWPVADAPPAALFRNGFEDP